MSANKRWRLVCYDVRDARRWRDVHRIIVGHGTRVQYSVYRARLDDKQVERLRWELSRVMAAEDALLIVDLCPTCAGAVVSKNHVDGWENPVPTFRILGGELGDEGEGGEGADGGEARTRVKQGSVKDGAREAMERPRSLDED